MDSSLSTRISILMGKLKCKTFYVWIFDESMRKPIPIGFVASMFLVRIRLFLQTQTRDNKTIQDNGIKQVNSVQVIDSYYPFGSQSWLLSGSE